jgi:hypothetical protein
MPNPYRFILAFDVQEARELMRQEGWDPKECFVIDEWNLPRGEYDFELFLFEGYNKRPIAQLEFIADFLKRCGNVKLTLKKRQPSYHFGFAQGVGARSAASTAQAYAQMHAKMYGTYYGTGASPQTQTSGGKVAIKVKIWWDENAGAYALTLSYNENFIKVLKQFIPDGDRSYDPNSKTWYFKESYAEFVRKLAQDMFTISAVSFVSKDSTEQARAYGQQKASQHNAYINPSSGGTTEDAVVAFFNLIPYDAARKCYLVAAGVLHPDKNQGDGSKMSKLNELWTRIEKEFFKR